MIDKYIVDTHDLIWHLVGNSRLGGNAEIVFQNPDSVLVLPIIALAEAIDIVQKGRTKIPNVETLLQDVFGDKRIEIEPLTVEILQESLNASAVPEMHDKLITSSALLLEKQGFSVAVLTRDQSIIDSNLVKIVW
jgi:PIN domain nuclease of toxin-antitoxin system